jgi:polysaccharide biosynthesis protein PslH
VAKLLYLVHRLPFPPNKGDKVRSYHVLRHLAEQHEVYLATFVDDPDDEQHVDTLRQWCADLCAIRLHPLRSRIASLQGLLTGDALTLRYYRNAAMARWVDDTVKAHGIDAAIVFSSSMAQYAEPHAGLKMLVDFVDVDSAKWTQFAEQHAWPMSWLYRREGRQLLAYEQRVAAQAARSFFVTEQEVQLFQSLSPGRSLEVQAMGNGVDADYFSPDAGRASPFDAQELPLVFTGAMDYWPNVDAVRWFVAEMLPELRRLRPTLRFHIVGRSPTPAVRELASDSVNVTGSVPDVRPYLQHAAAVVAPLRLARGVQNKVLEAMAMARPVVAAQTCVGAIDAASGKELLSASSPEQFVVQLDQLLANPENAQSVGQAARARVLASYSWRAHLSAFDRFLPASNPALQPH